MDDVQAAIDITRQALWLTLLISAPLLIVGLVVGVLISVLQAATQVQEQTLTFVPKIVAVVLALIVSLPWITTVMLEYTEDLLVNLGRTFH